MSGQLPQTAPGIGVDMVDVARFGESLQRSGKRMQERVFTADEWAECQTRSEPTIHLAARFAAKEAVMKSLGTGWTDGVGFHEIEVTSDGKTPPLIRISGRTAELAAEAGIAGFRVSMSHTDHLAIAMVVAELA
ncbi:MAG: holo-ACP synthase [Planctomycetes bacterium]|nr:holo-ACP synthase [Planctomycetota bacterium]